ncbi:MAG: hypothetical protein GW859_05200 [Sphingomonadales bacterium]|nr:hypothetical protein [Sphingomonadales bacterium]
MTDETAPAQSGAVLRYAPACRLCLTPGAAAGKLADVMVPRRPAAILISLAAALSACGPVPADIEGTEQRLRDGDTMIVGIVAAPVEQARARAIADRAGSELGMAYRLETGTAEATLAALAEGEIDLAIGKFAKQSPWQKEVHLSRAIGAEPPSGKEPAWRIVTRNGENRWAMTVDRLTGRIAPAP